MEFKRFLEASEYDNTKYFVDELSNLFKKSIGVAIPMIVIKKIKIDSTTNHFIVKYGAKGNSKTMEIHSFVDDSPVDAEPSTFTAKIGKSIIRLNGKDAENAIVLDLDKKYTDKIQKIIIDSLYG